MKLIHLIIAIGLSSCGCSFKNHENKVACVDSVCYYQIKDTSDFWLYSEFLLKYPETRYYKNALSSYYKKRDEYYDSIGWPIIDCFRNCANIKIRPNQDIMFEYEKIELVDIKDSLMTFLLNENYSVLKPEKREIEDLNGVIQEISKGHVELSYVKDSCENLQRILIEISESYDLYKNYLSEIWYKMEIDDLDEKKKIHLDSLFQYRLFFYEFDKEYLPPPPPPELEVNVLNIVEDEVIIDE